MSSGGKGKEDIFVWVESAGNFGVYAIYFYYSGGSWYCVQIYDDGVLVIFMNLGVVGDDVLGFFFRDLIFNGILWEYVFNEWIFLISSGIWKVWVVLGSGSMDWFVLGCGIKGGFGIMSVLFYVVGWSAN